MKLALDANILIEVDLFNKAVIERLKDLRKITSANPVLAAPVVSEYYYGFLASRKKDLALKNLEEYEILNTTKNSALLFADIRYALEKSGKIIPDMDILIAAICMDNNVTLITSDRQFEKIKELDKIIIEI